MANFKVSDFFAGFALATSIVAIVLTILQRNDTHRASRAYVGIDSVEFDGEYGSKLTLLSTGGTPALKVQVLLGCSFGNHNGAEWKAPITNSSVLEHDLLPPGASRSLSCDPSGDNLSIGHGPRLVNVRVLKGVAIYDDVFGTLHHTTFCYSQKRWGAGTNLEPCPEGNSSD